MRRMPRWGGVAALALGCAGAPPGGHLPALAVTEGRAGGVHVIFHALDCQLYSQDLRRLDSLAARASMPLSGTVLLGSISASELPAVVADFHLTFPITSDLAGEYARLVEYLGEGPVIAIRRHRRPLTLLAGPGAIAEAVRWLRDPGERS